MPIFDKNDKNILCKCLERYAETSLMSVFDISFSGEKSWIVPKVENVLDTTIDILTNNTLKITIQIKLNADDPSVVFFNDKVLKEELPLEKPFPIVKIELNSNAKVKHNVFDCGQIDTPATINKDKCCLKKGVLPQDEIEVSLYHFFQPLILKRAEIKVEVCGVKNLIVQNDENLQDVNKPIQPFGPRPKVGEDWFIDGGANFYIGSKEIFCKNWQKFWINTTWKDKPLDLEKAYKFYEDPESSFKFEDNSEKITNNSFRFLTSILEDGIWKHDKIHRLPTGETEPLAEEFLKLFDSSNHESPDYKCQNISNKSTFHHGLEEGFFDRNYTPKSMPVNPLTPLAINTRKGFARITLAGVSFQHERFPFVLTKQMMALADLVDPKTISDSLEDLKKLGELGAKAKDKINAIIAKINSLVLTINGFTVPIALNNVAKFQNSLPSFQPIIIRANQIKGFLNAATAAFNANPQDIAAAETAVGNAQNTIDSLINSDLLSFNTAISILNSNITAYNNSITQHNQDISDLKVKVVTDVTDFKNNVNNELEEIKEDLSNMTPIDPNDEGVLEIIKEMCDLADSLQNRFGEKLEIGLPIEPYTPLIKSLSIDYTAKAEIDDIDIIHLYPFANTSKHEDIEQNPTLFPFHDKEGTLFIGIEDLTPGSNLSILFQLAEATANSETNRANIHWEYLSNNNWIELLPDFNIISDETDGLTVSGIVTIAIPDTINKIGNTVMPDTLYWLRVSAKNNAMAVAETIGIHTQAAKASARLSDKNDTKRLHIALEAGSVSKLVEADFSVKKVEQLYPSFGGKQPEGEGHYYVRVSEHLKHKGRALMINDYEKIVLEDFPEIYKVKCISHTMGLSAITYQKDLEVAPGFVVVTVIPDLTKLLSGSQLEPKVPVSILEKIGNLLRKKTSPFAKIKVMNPRYEYVDVDITIRLYRGKSTDFYKRKLKEDITNLLAPWFLGDSEKIAFGQSVLFSDIVGFVEQLDYVDFITKLELKDERGQTASQIIPLTARSILTAGKICVDIDKEECLGEPNQNREFKTSIPYKNINEPSELS